MLTIPTFFAARKKKDGSVSGNTADWGGGFTASILPVIVAEGEFKTLALWRALARIR
jgi:hypothetical protein